jgi:hypothetical protein
MAEFSMAYSVKNTNHGSITVIIEPWAEEFSLPADSILLITVRCAQSGQIETEIGPGRLSLWLWGGCRVRVSIDDQDKTPPSLSIPAPAKSSEARRSRPAFNYP